MLVPNLSQSRSIAGTRFPSRGDRHGRGHAYSFKRASPEFHWLLILPAHPAAIEVADQQSLPNPIQTFARRQEA
jgi:hypothetical protein